MNSKYDRALSLASKSRGRTREVYDLLVSADSAGDARATYALATWYLHGTKFTKRDIARGTELLQRAVKKNIPDAAHDLAVSFEKGIGVQKSERKAFELYVRAALLGDRQSLYEVGRMYYHGIGASKNRHLAEVWLDCAEHFGVTK
jgi:TPR repeat protein